MLTFRDAIIIAAIVVAALWLFRRPGPPGAVTRPSSLPSGKRQSLCFKS